MNDRIRDGSEGTVEASLYSLSFNVLAIHGGSAYVKFSSWVGWKRLIDWL